MKSHGMVDTIVSAIDRLVPTQARRLIAIAGPPASGKSTLAEQVRQRLIADGNPCGLVPMDGFHLDNAVLEKRGALARKGAPETFDVQGFHSLLQELLRCDDVAIPLFDRETDRVVEAAGQVEREHRYVVVEGNYLFLDQPDWRDLQTLWSLGVFLRPPLELLEGRLVQRWLDHGHSLEEARERTAGNDLINARTVLEKSDYARVDVLL